MCKENSFLNVVVNTRIDLGKGNKTASPLQQQMGFEPWAFVWTTVQPLGHNALTACISQSWQSWYSLFLTLNFDPGTPLPAGPGSAGLALLTDCLYW